MADQSVPPSAPDTPPVAWPDGQLRVEAPYRCGTFVTATCEQCVLLSDHDGQCEFPREIGSKAGEIRWLLGFRFAENPQWVARCAVGGGVYPTADANEAMWFCRKRDAITMLESLDDSYGDVLRAEEHLWLNRNGADVPPSAPDTKPDEPPRMFPLLDGPAIPWASIAPFEKQAQRNHNQTLERLAQRGGLSVCEALHVMLCVEWHRGDPKSAELNALSRRDATLKLTELALSSSPPEGEDTKRLDWLERNSAVLSVFDPPSGDSWVWEVSATDDANKPCEPSGQGDTLREAIDSARAAIPPQEKR